MFFRQQRHEAERAIVALGTQDEMYMRKCSCGWIVQDYDPNEVELMYTLHLAQYRQADAGHQAEIEAEYEREFYGQKVRV